MNILTPFFFQYKKGEKAKQCGTFLFLHFISHCHCIWQMFFSYWQVLGLLWWQLWILWRLTKVVYCFLKWFYTRELMAGPEAKQWGAAWIQALPQLGNSSFPGIFCVQLTRLDVTHISFVFISASQEIKIHFFPYWII